MKDPIIPAAIRGRMNENGTYDQRLEPRDDVISNTITTVQKDNVLITDPEFNRSIALCIESCYKNGVWIRKSNGKPRRQVVAQGTRLRRLTPRECWRLMGFTDTDFNKARNALNSRFHKGADRSDSQLYKQAGNSIVVDVLLHIFEKLHETMPYLFKDIKAGSFFSGIGAFEKALKRLGETE